jgi:endonuclease/exonuclease/phosphatase family metal-dependent hydrolase
VWFSVNLRSGGLALEPDEVLLRRHGSLSLEWLRRLPDVVALSPERPDAIFLQEATGFDREGDELLLYVERRLRRAGFGAYRGFLTRATRSPDHQAVLLNADRLVPVHHWRGADPDEPRGLYGFVEVLVGGDGGQTLWVKSIHLNPRDPDDRVAEVREIHYSVPQRQRAILAGDWNSITSRRGAEHGEPQRDFAAMPAAERYRKGRWPATKSDGDTDPDTRALDFLLDSGWTCQHIALHNTTPTTTPGYELGGELITSRCLTRGALALHSIWVDTGTMPYSDHRAFGGRVAVVCDPCPRATTKGLR